MQIQGHTFLVTGAGSGLGEGTARRLAKFGGNVIAADIQAATVAKLADELGGNVRSIAADITQTPSVQAAVDLAVREFGALHGVVHCAGILGGARVVGKEGPHDLDLFRRVIEVNLIGTFNVLRLAAASMAGNEPNADGERGVVVCTSSISTYEGQIGQAAYSASKGGVSSMMLPIARELSRIGIRTVAIAPGVFGTAMIDALPDNLQQSLTGQAVFPARLGRPDEFAAMAQHIIENPMLNGSTLRLDGAMRMGAK